MITLIKVHDMKGKKIRALQYFSSLSAVCERSGLLDNTHKTRRREGGH